MSESNKCEADVMLTSMPPQYRCGKCGQIWKEGEATPTCHSITPNWKQVKVTMVGHEPSTTPSWEAEFDEHFGVAGSSGTYRGVRDHGIKAFIQSLLERKEAEAVALGESLKWTITPTNDAEANDIEVHNEAITTYQTKLSTKK